MHPSQGRSLALSIDSVCFRYPGSAGYVLKDINVKIDVGEKVALIGPNGAGKSTLMKLILGLERLQSGTIDIFGYKANICHHRVAMVPQKSNLNFSFPLTVRQVVSMGRYAHLGFLKGLGPSDKKRVEEAMALMQISELADCPLAELSGGQQQRVMLARTLAQDADLLLLDEPLNHVDLSTQELIFHALEDLCQRGKAVIVSTHDLGILTVHFSRVLFLDKTIIADGPAEKVLSAPFIAHAYGFEFHPGGKYGTLKLDH